MPSVDERILQRIRTELATQGMSLTTLANKAGLSKSHLSAFLRGKKSISTAGLSRVAYALGHGDSLFYRAPEEDQGPSERFRKMVLDSRQLCEKEKRALLTDVRSSTHVSLMKLFDDQRWWGYHSLVCEHVQNDRTLLLPAPDEPHAITHLNYTGTYRMAVAVAQGRCTAIPYLQICSYDSRGTEFRDFKQELDLPECDVPGSGLELWRGCADGTELQYAEVRIRQPLTRGQRARIAINESYRCAHVAHAEHLLGLIARGKLISRAPFEYANLACRLPTLRLTNRVTFPLGYEPQDFGFSVTLTRIRLEDEVRRLEDWKALNVRRNAERQWVCTLDVQRPLTGAVYGIEWVPPSEDAYAQLLREKGKRRARSSGK